MGLTVPCDKVVEESKGCLVSLIMIIKFMIINLGLGGVAKWMNEHGYVKFIGTHNGHNFFAEPFIEDVIRNYAYIGKIAYGRRKIVLRDGTEDEYHKVETDDFLICDGHHEPIIDTETWEAAQIKKKANGGRRDTIEKDHQYIYSTLIKCPIRICQVAAAVMMR